MNHSTSLKEWGPVRQLGYVVEDLDKAVEAWTQQLGIGPWMLMRNIELQAIWHGQPSRPAIDIALAYRGEQQIELIQQTNMADSPYRAFIDKKQFGLHHIAFLCEHIEQAISSGEAAGLKLACDIRMPMGGGRYVYFESPVPGEKTFIELLQASGTMKQMFAAGMISAREWQGEGKPIVFNMGPLMRVMRLFQRRSG